MAKKVEAVWSSKDKRGSCVGVDVWTILNSYKPLALTVSDSPVMAKKVDAAWGSKDKRGSCAGVDVWTILKRFGLQVEVGDEEVHTASSEVSEQGSVISRAKLREKVASPRIQCDRSVEGMISKWSTFSEGPLTYRHQSLQQWQHSSVLDSAGDDSDGYSLPPGASLSEKLTWFRNRDSDITVSENLGGYKFAHV
jgi:hypothetical protein